MKADTLTLEDGRLFPTHDGVTPLSWAISSCLEDEQAGYPKLRAVVRAMIVHRPAQLERERFELLKASFNKVFGQNARRELNVIEQEIAKRSN